MKSNYRIQTQDGKFINAGSGLNSWFFLAEARKKVNYSKGERIVECDGGVRILWEVL